MSSVPSQASSDPPCRYAVANTRRGIESCGLLAGTLFTDADGTNMFKIDTLIIPKQEGTTDTVQVLLREQPTLVN